MFSCEYCKIFQNNFFYRTSPVAASPNIDDMFLQAGIISFSFLWFKEPAKLELFQKVVPIWYIFKIWWFNVDLINFYSPWNIQEIFRFLMVSGGVGFK